MWTWWCHQSYSKILGGHFVLVILRHLLLQLQWQFLHLLWRWNVAVWCHFRYSTSWWLLCFWNQPSVLCYLSSVLHPKLVIRYWKYQDVLFRFRQAILLNTVFFSPLLSAVHLHHSLHSLEELQSIDWRHDVPDIHSYQSESWRFHHQKDILPRLLPIQFSQHLWCQETEMFLLVSGRFASRLYFVLRHH